MWKKKICGLKSCYVIGLLFFTNAVDERMNLFGMSINLMGVLPNTWTLIAAGNVDLSITITVINTVLACGECRNG